MAMVSTPEIAIFNSKTRKGKVAKAAREFMTAFNAKGLLIPGAH